MDALRNLKKNYPPNFNCSLFLSIFQFDSGGTSYTVLYFYVIGDNTPRKAHLRPANQVLAIFNPLILLILS